MPLWIYFAIALIAGALPARVLWGKGMMFMDGIQLRARFNMLNPGDNRRRRRWWKSPSVWVDPARGWVAGWYACHGAWKAWETMGYWPCVIIEYGTYLGVMGLVLLQCTGREDQKETLTPILFIGGLILGYFGWVPGASVITLGLLGLISLRSLPGALFVMAGTTAAVGWVFIGVSPIWLVAISLSLIPWAKSFLLRHRLVIALRG